MTKALRRTFEGLRDKVLIGSLSKPPKTGFNGITWQLLSQGEDIAAEVTALQKEFDAWVAGTIGRASTATAPALGKEGVGEIAKMQISGNLSFFI